VRCERFNRFNYKLSIFSDVARTIPIAGSPVFGSTSDNPISMKIFHSSTASGGGGARTLTGTLDDLEIFNGFSPSSFTGGLVLDDDFSTYGTPVTPDFTDVFDSATGWTTTDSTRARIEDDQGFLFFMAVRDGSNDQIARDILGGTISDTEWLLSFKFTVTKLATPTGDNLVCNVSLRDVDQNTGTETSSDSLVFESVRTTGGSSLLRIRAMNNQTYPAGSSTQFSTPLAIGTLYVQLIRVSATLLEGRLYDDENYSNLIEKVTLSISSGITALRFLGVANLNSGSATGDFDVTIDDVQFWDGRSTTCDSSLTGSIPTKTITGADDANWVQTGSQITISGGVISGWGPDGSLQSQTYDIQSNDGFTMDDTKWLAEFKFNITAFATSSGHFIFALVDTAGDLTAGVRYASLFIHKQTGPDPILNAVLSVNDGVTSFLSTGIGIQSFPSTDLFVRLERLSPTQFKLAVAFDLAHTNPLVGSPVTLTQATFTNIVGLDHIQSRTSTGGSASRNITGTLRDMKIFNGIIIPWVSTNPPVIFVDPCAENIVVEDSSGDQNIIFDLGTPLSNDKWVMRWSQWTERAFQGASGNNTFLWVGVSSTGALANVVQDFIGYNASLDFNTDEQRILKADNTN